ncbi:MAG: hypothetical protein GC150_12450 [Rhizobiales bacterium]|nr:hypothetical protein [Hyphomicrobiales bacterium]
MPLIPIAQPSVEPVAIEDTKAHLRVDSPDEDTLIASLVSAARVHLEQQLAIAMIAQSWTYVLDRWPREYSVCLPLHPVMSVDVIRVLAGDGSVEVVDPATYLVDAASRPSRIVRRTGAVWPKPTRVLGGIEIDFTAGFSATGIGVPQPLRQAILRLVAHWFERRELIEVGRSVAPLPVSVEELVRPYRRIRL